MAAYVIKRNGRKEELDINKVTKRLLNLIDSPTKLKGINAAELSQVIINECSDNMRTQEIDESAAARAASMITNNLDYGVLAGRIAINNHHKKTLNGFRDKMYLLYNNTDKLGVHSPLISKKFLKFVDQFKFMIEKNIDYNRDYLIDYFGFKAMECSYLSKINGNVIERPQDLWMRTAIFIHMKDEPSEDVLEDIFETYNLLSLKKICQASPTLYNSGTNQPQCFSCFLLGTEDSTEGINKTFCDMAQISRRAGGIGIHVSNIRSSGSLIRGTNGGASGLIPPLKIFNDCICMYNQGGRRPGNAAVYLEVHHPDILHFLELKLVHGSDKMRARDLSLAVWISDLFMKRVEQDGDWDLLCPDECKGLNDVWGEEYEELYNRYVAEGRSRKRIKARVVLYSIYKSIKECGMPYICFKDTANRYNLHSNIGLIRSSNLCSEIYLYSDHKEYAVCCLANLVLDSYVYDCWTDEEMAASERRQLNHEFPQNPIFNYKELIKNTGILVRNLDKLLEKNFYPTVETVRSSFRTRAIGIGVQGLADVFMKFRAPFDSELATQLNKNIFEAIQFGAMGASVDICEDIYKEARRQVKDDGKFTYCRYPQHVLQKFPELLNEVDTKEYNDVSQIPRTIGSYPAYLENGGSPIANGKAHWMLYNASPNPMFDWESLMNKINVYGMRHSHLTAVMPTAGTSQVMGTIECIEPYKSNIYMRKVQAGEYMIINKYLINDLSKINYNMKHLKNYLMYHDGTIRGLEDIPIEVRNLHKTAYEISAKTLIKLARDRQPWVDQGQSMNLFFQDYTYDQHFFKSTLYAWKCQLKTGVYYTRTKPSVKAQNIQMDPELEKKLNAIPLKKNNSKPNTEEQICLSCQ